MVYKVIGLMSGSSLDGLDVAYTELTEISGKWSYEIVTAECLPYPAALADELRRAHTLTVPEFLRLHTSYGHYLGEQVNHFIKRNNLQHKVHFVASHGHTVWHEPAARTTAQIGDGAAIAGWTLLPVISDLRHMDVALGGQGAPIVPIADKLLFSDYDFCLNLGGIANVTVNGPEPLAFDICPANQLLNHFALRLEKEFDDKGAIARSGSNNEAVLERVNQVAYYGMSTPKSLHNGFVTEEVLPHFEALEKMNDALYISTRHIAAQVARALQPYIHPLKEQKMLVTGGGAFNDFLVETIKEELNREGNIELIIPDEATIKHKEAVAMALIGTLRWREENNVLHSVTGAARNSAGGALWLPPVD